VATNGFKVFQRQARAYIKTIPRLIGKVALLEARDNFRRQGAENENGVFVPWAPRKAKAPKRRPRGGGGAGIRGRAILVHQHLRNGRHGCALCSAPAGGKRPAAGPPVSHTRQNRAGENY
jgi:hypothetical protein